MWISYKNEYGQNWINLNRVKNITVSDKEILFNFRSNAVSDAGDDYIRVSCEAVEYKLIKNFLENKFECYPIR